MEAWKSSGAWKRKEREESERGLGNSPYRGIGREGEGDDVTGRTGPTVFLVLATKKNITPDSH